MVSVMFTDKGLRAYELSTRRESIHKVMSDLSEQERRQLRSILGKLLEKALGEIGKPAEGQYRLS
jgi:DNA-binding MarR family transcriptional regulator